MRRFSSSLHHRDQLRQVRKDFERVPRKRKPSWVKMTLLALLLVFVGLIIYIGASAYTSANEILDNNLSFMDIISGSNLKESKGVTNLLILGRGGSNHPGGQLTDTIILARLRQSDKKLAMISIPRDLLVTIPGVGQKKVNEAYAIGFNSEKDKNKRAEAGAKMASQVVEKTAGVPIHYYISVDFAGFRELVDILGGVTVDVEKDINDPEYPKEYFTKDGDYVKTNAFQTFTLKAGRQVLNGETALKYARSRHSGNGEGSDFARARRQQRLLVAIRDKALTVGVLANPKKVTDIFSSLSGHVKTNLTVSEIKELIELLKGVDKNAIINKVIDNGQGGLLVSSSEGFYHLLPRTGNFAETQKVIENIFTDEVSSSALLLSQIEVEVYNATSTTGLAGEIAKKLEAEGLTVTKIETAEEESDSTIIYDSSGNPTALAKITKYFPSAEVERYNQPGVIKVVIGKDYGN
ncbi:MAG: LCP family protein [Candidatus Berkelbacteria bacterium]|nr:LCP family protein [Candidatus Berkelbacteria bacterium]